MHNTSRCSTSSRPRDLSISPPHHHYSETEGRERGSFNIFPNHLHKGPRALRGSNAFHSRVASTYTDHILRGKSENPSSQESSDRHVYRGRVGEVRTDSHWLQGRLPPHHSTVDERVARRRSGRYHPYESQDDEYHPYEKYNEYGQSPPPTRNYKPSHRDRDHEPSRRSSRPSHREPIPEAPLAHRRRLRPDTSPEEDVHIDCDRNSPGSTATPSPPAEGPKESMDLLTAQVKMHVKNLTPEERKKFLEELTGQVVDQPSTRKTNRPSTSPVKAPVMRVEGLLSAPMSMLVEDVDNTPETTMVIEQLDRVLDGLEAMTATKLNTDNELDGVLSWFKPLLDKLDGRVISQLLDEWQKSEKVVLETITKLAKDAKVKADELSAKAASEVEKIEAAEKEKTRLTKAACEDFETIVTGQGGELELLSASVVAKAEELQRKAEKIDTPNEITKKAFAAANKKMTARRRE